MSSSKPKRHCFFRYLRKRKWGVVEQVPVFGLWFNLLSMGGSSGYSLEEDHVPMRVLVERCRPKDNILAIRCDLREGWEDRPGHVVGPHGIHTSSDSVVVFVCVCASPLPCPSREDRITRMASAWFCPLSGRWLSLRREFCAHHAGCVS